MTDMCRFIETIYLRKSRQKRLVFGFLYLHLSPDTNTQPPHPLIISTALFKYVRLEGDAQEGVGGGGLFQATTLPIRYQRLQIQSVKCSGHILKNSLTYGN